MADNVGNFRSAIIPEPQLIAGGGPNVMRTMVGNVHSNMPLVPPPLPPPIQQAGGYAPMGYSQNMGMGGFNAYSSPYSGFGGGYGGAGYGSYGGAYGGSYGGGGYGGGYNRFGQTYMNPNDPENRFIQIAEEGSRPAFQSIESLVAAIGNIASMLDSTFFAITSSFRAILGVAANFGRLRGVFAQFWQTFAIFRSLNWVYKKLLYWLRVSKIDPSSAIFKEAFAAAAQGAVGAPLSGTPKGQSPWPVLTFLGFIFTAPYIIMKLIGTVTSTALEESRNPARWVNPIHSKVLYDFKARNASELNIRAGQTILVAPKEIQNTQKLLNTGWALASVNRETSGLIPISYIQGPHQMRLTQQQLHQGTVNGTPDSMPYENQIYSTEQNPISTGADFLSNQLTVVEPNVV